MGGEIGVLSELGKGSTFWFTAELEEATEGELPMPASPESIRGKRLLIVDANPTFCEVMRGQAESWEMMPEFACDGTAALVMLRAASDRGRPFDLVSLNHEMPGTTGLHVARAMQLDERLWDTPRLLLTTASSRLPATALADAGVSISLPKPAATCDFRRAFAQTLGDEEKFARQGEKRLEERPGYDALRVLVVEDNRVNQLVVQGMLKKLGVQPDLAADGLKAVAAFEAADPPYDLILMDCEMPEVDGFEATQRIRSREKRSRRRAVPIVALSAHVMLEARDRMVECGMNGHIAKPISVAELISLLDSVANGEDVVVR